MMRNTRLVGRFVAIRFDKDVSQNRSAGNEKLMVLMKEKSRLQDHGSSEKGFEEQLL